MSGRTAFVRAGVRGTTRSSVLALISFLVLTAGPSFADTILFGPRTYRQTGTGTPPPVLLTTRAFTAADPSGVYMLRAVKSGAASATVTLNGETVIDPADLLAMPSPTSGTLKIPVTLIAGTNEVVVELAGTSGSALTISILKDTTSPTIVVAGTPKANANGWNKGAVTVKFTCSDTGSGIGTCPAPVVVSTEGAGQVFSGTATDKSGNSATANISLSIDKTAPVVTAVADPLPNAGGWNRGPVTVTFSATDALSGVTPGSLSAPVTLATDGKNLSATGQATDLAGKVGAITKKPIKIDQTPPAIAAALTPAANAEGWNNSPVTAHFTCTDTGSGIASCPSDRVLSAEGAQQPIAVTATDRAGNTAPPLQTVSLDMTPPTFVITAPGPVVSSPTVTITGTLTDALSGVAAVTGAGVVVSPQPDGSFSLGPLPVANGLNTFALTGRDRAGNARQQTVSVTKECSNLVQDPGFESGVSGFFAQEPSDQVSQIDTSPLEGARSLLVAINGYGNNVWWTHLTPGGRASHFGVSAHLRSEVASASGLQFCAMAYYGDGTTAIQCTPVTGALGDKGIVAADLDLDASKDLASVRIRLYQEGSAPVRFALDSALACLDLVSAPPSPSPSPVPTATPVPSPSPTPVPSPSPSSSPSPSPSPTPTPLPSPTPPPSPACTNLVQDPGFESGVSSFWAQDATSQVSQTDIAPLEGSHSLLVTMNGWGNNIWWDHGFAGGRASAFRIRAHLRSEQASSSELLFCAFAKYADGTDDQNCATVGGAVGDKGDVSAVVNLESTKPLERLSMRLHQVGSNALRFTTDSAMACLDVVAPPPPNPQPTPTPNPSATPPPPPSPPPGCEGPGQGNGSPNGPTDGPFPDGVTVHLTRIYAGGDLVSFGVPVPPGVNLTDVSSVRVLQSGAPLPSSVREILGIHDRCGVRTAVRAIQVQFDASLMTGNEMDVEVVWRGTTGAAPGTTIVPYGDDRVSATAPETVDTTVRTIVSSGGVNMLVEAPHELKTLFTAREPHVLATFPDTYLARTGILGQQVTTAEAHQPQFAGLAFLSDAVVDHGLSSMYDVGYALNPDPESVVDPQANFEGWLYDRCATYLTAFAHTNDARFLREANRTCRYYASKINLTGPDGGIFSGKPDPDPKYSHLRGLYAYYALTGDEMALQAGTAIADMWYADPVFVLPYRAGHVLGPDRIWTERLLGTSFEGLYYGHRLTGESKYLYAFDEMFDTAYRHITGDAATLGQINPGIPVSFPPQNCFIHTAEQHTEGSGDQPWCSSWMSELTIDALLRYQEQTSDERAGEVFVRLARYLRDVGSAYFDAGPLNNLDDDFLHPVKAYDPADGEGIRRLVPLYGAGLGPDLVRRNFGEWEDSQHCPDATALTAAALRALKAQGGYDQNPIGPFASEGASLLQLHHEFAACAAIEFVEKMRPRRDPRVWTSAQLAPGLADPAAFIRANKIGYPIGNNAPQRRLSWWFNMSMLQFGLLAEAGITVPALTPGIIQPSQP